MLDTLKYYKKLIGARVLEKEAEVHVQFLAEMTCIIEGQMLTKQNLKAFGVEFKTDIIKCIAGMLVVQIFVILAIVKLI